MPEVSHLRRQRLVETTVDFGDGDSVTVTFDRNKVTPGWVQETEDRKMDALAIPKALADVILSWDVTDEGQEFPPTPENIGVFSFGVQRALVTNIIETSVPGVAEGNASSEQPNMPSSVSTPPKPTSQNGPATSPLLEPSVSPYQT